MDVRSVPRFEQQRVVSVTRTAAVNELSIPEHRLNSGPARSWCARVGTLIEIDDRDCTESRAAGRQLIRP